MKKILSALKSTVLVALFICSQANAQDVASGNSKFLNPNNSPASEVTNNTSVPSVAANINKKAIKDFVKTYKSNVQPVWGITQSGGFTASYTEADVRNCVYYNKEGTWVCNIKWYDEARMSMEIRRIVKPVYYDYTITGVTEITVPEGIVHLVYLAENGTSFKTIRICNGEMDVIKWIKNNKIMKL